MPLCVLYQPMEPPGSFDRHLYSNCRLGSGKECLQPDATTLPNNLYWELLPSPVSQHDRPHLVLVRWQVMMSLKGVVQSSTAYSSLLGGWVGLVKLSEESPFHSTLLHCLELEPRAYYMYLIVCLPFILGLLLYGLSFWKNILEQSILEEYYNTRNGRLLWAGYYYPTTLACSFSLIPDNPVINFGLRQQQLYIVYVGVCQCENIFRVRDNKPPLCSGHTRAHLRLWERLTSK